MSGEAGLLFVLGMHRSGTSALCAALAAAGASFGDELLDPMAGVNEAGFWEDQRLVETNERLLAAAGSHWYSAVPGLAATDWLAPPFDSCREEARALLQAVTAAGAVAALKDPRLCLTLPFWLALCGELAIDARCCAIGRPALEVAASLEQRDGFPPGYGLRLAATYGECLARHLPAGSPLLSYADLLADPAAAVGALVAAGLLPDPGEVAFAASVRGELQHQQAAGQGPLYQSHPDPVALAAAVEAAYPLEELPPALADQLVARGRQLTDIGEAHSAALATLDQRDAELRFAVTTVEQRDREIAALDRRLAETGDHLERALATLDERDKQIGDLDARLHEEGRRHGEALAHIERLDARLQRVIDTPVVGPAFRLAWSRACREEGGE